MGEHAAVYGHPALVATIDLRLRVTLSPRDDKRVQLVLPALGFKESYSWDEILEDTRRCRELWQSCFGENTTSSAESYRPVGPADRLVRVALGETAIHGKLPPMGVRVHIDGDLPSGSGFGSSAAMAVCVAGALLRFSGRSVNNDLLHQITMDVERRQHGTPSGVDHNAILRGGLLFAHRDEAGELALEPIPSEPSVLSRFRVFHSGTPAEPTGMLVAAVRRRIRRARRRFRRVLETIDVATRELRILICGGGDESRILTLIREAEAALEDLGVVPEPIKRIIRKIEAAGGAAKISGAGALSGDQCGSVLVYHPDPEHIANWEFLEGWRPLPVTLGSEGLRSETDRTLS